jgi:hypothetical protein
LHAHNSGFLSKFGEVDEKYRKCQKNINFYFKNPLLGNPGPIHAVRGGKVAILLF